MSENTNQAEASRQTFWKLVNNEKYTIKIPRIQRDYAQGRDEAEPKQIRQSFLKDAFDALLNDRIMDINFVYGNIMNEASGEKVFIPIDGQQRLTTMFLLHWYFASWSGKLDEYAESLKRFQYDTRFVAGGFCKRLVENVHVNLKELATTERTLTETIKDYFWFFSSYERDATIKAMIVMLQSIHDVVRGMNDRTKLDGFFDKLTSDDCPISFLFLDIADLGLTDEIYIKMNARGKALTRFENFKAQLSGYLSEKDEDFAREFIGNINGRWSGFFWNEEYRPAIESTDRNSEPRKSNIFDDQIMNLFRFMMFNEYVTRVELASESTSLKELARKTLGILNRESDFEFVSRLFADEFRTVGNFSTDNGNVDEKTFRQINTLLNVLAKRKEETGSICFLDNELYSKKYYDEELYFKRLIKSVTGKPLAYEDQLVIYAEYLFLIKYAEADYSFNKCTELTNWVRFIYNLSRDVVYNTVDDYLRSAQRVRKIVDSGEALDVLTYAALTLHKTYGPVSGYGFVEYGMKEECIKAHLILKSDEWRKSIIEAENSFLDSQTSAILAFSGVWSMYETEMDAFESINDSATTLNSVNAVLNNAVSDPKYLEAFKRYLKKINLIFTLDSLRPEMEEKSIFRRALLTYGGEDSYMLPAGKPVRCFLDVNDRDNSFKRLLRDENRKNKEDKVGVRIFLKYLLDDIDEQKELVPQLEQIIANAKYDEKSKWKQHFIEMPEILDSLYRKNGDITEDVAVFKNSKRFINVVNPDEVLLLEKIMTSSNNREYYSYVLYLKAQKEGVDISYHKNFGAESAKFAFYTDESDRVIHVSYGKDSLNDEYVFAATCEDSILFSTSDMNIMLKFIKGENPSDDDGTGNAVEENPLVADEVDCHTASAELINSLLISDVFSDNKFNRFRRYCFENGLQTMGELVGFDFQSLLSISGIGRGKYEEIIARAQETFNGSLMISSTNSENSVTAKHLFAEIDEDFTNQKIAFLQGVGVRQKSIDRLIAGGFETIKDLQGVSENRLQEIMTAGDYERLHNAEPYFCMPIKELYRFLIDDSANDPSYAIAMKRADGYTLEQIGREYNVSRERIRQRVRDFVNGIAPIVSAIGDKLLDNRKYFTREDIVNFLDEENYYKLLFLCFTNRDDYEYLGFAETFVSLRGNNKHHENDILSIAIELVGNGVDIRDILEDMSEQMNEKGYSFVDKDAFLNILQQNGYYLYGNYIAKGKQSYGLLCAKIVEKRFPDGIKLYEGADLDLLREYALKEYGEIGISPDNRAFSTRLSDYLVLSGKGCVTAESNVHIDVNVLEKIKEYIDSSNQREIYYSEIFSIFRDELVRTGNVDNYNFLHGVLKLYYPDLYDYSDRDFLVKNGEGLTSGKFTTRLQEFIEEQGRPVSKNEIKQRFPGITDIVLFSAIDSNDTLLPWGYNRYFSIKSIQIDDSDKAYLKATIEKMFDIYRGYCSDKMLFDTACAENSAFIEKNNLEEASNLFYICMSLFKDEYDFRRPHITRAGLVETISVKTVALHLLNYPLYLHFNDYQNISELLKWSPVTAGMVFTEIEEDYIRLTSDTYIKRDNIMITESMVMQVEKTLRDGMNNGIISLINFSQWESLPKVDYEWSIYLLRDIVDKFIRSLKVIEPRFTDRRYEKGIVVDANSTMVEYADLVTAELRNASLLEITERDLLAFLIANGLTYKAIPKELYATSKLRFDDGTFYVN